MSFIPFSIALLLLGLLAIIMSPLPSTIDHRLSFKSVLLTGVTMLLIGSLLLGLGK